MELPPLPASSGSRWDDLNDLVEVLLGALMGIVSIVSLQEQRSADLWRCFAARQPVSRAQHEHSMLDLGHRATV